MRNSTGISNVSFLLICSCKKTFHSSNTQMQILVKFFNCLSMNFYMTLKYLSNNSIKIFHQQIVLVDKLHQLVEAFFLNS